MKKFQLYVSDENINIIEEAKAVLKNDNTTLSGLFLDCLKWELEKRKLDLLENGLINRLIDIELFPLRHPKADLDGALVERASSLIKSIRRMQAEFTKTSCDYADSRVYRESLLHSLEDIVTTMEQSIKSE